MYEPNCGLDKVLMSFGHDEYLYRVLIGNEQCRLPEESLAIVRFHSFYPWHTGGDYDHLCNDKDRSMLKWIREFKLVPPSNNYTSLRFTPPPLCLTLPPTYHHLLLFLLPCSKFDLYSKADNLPKPEELMDYYQNLIDKYIPGVLNW